MRILIAEDDELSLLIVESTIKQFGHECLTASDGLAAWEQFQSTAVDVVISDWVMPGIDGIELCRRIRADARPGYTSFIFLTALSDKSNILAGIEAGADDYLAKPLDPDELRVRLLVASRLTRLHQRLAEQAAELERLNQLWFAQGRIDALTGVGNRLQLREDLDVISRHLAQGGHGYCALMCDVDSFKAYNDYYGHAAGDVVLQAIAKMLVMKSSRPGDRVYRYGGEEFLLILPTHSGEAGEVVAERIRRGVEDLALVHAPGQASPIITVSIGVAVLSASGTHTIAAWLKAADAALYAAKRSGRNRIVAESAGYDAVESKAY